MKSAILPRGRRVLWGSAMAACLLSGFLLIMSKIPAGALKGDSTNVFSRSEAVPRVAQGSHLSPEASANPGYLFGGSTTMGRSLGQAAVELRG
jgi:hypothetical protein